VDNFGGNVAVRDVLPIIDHRYRFATDRLPQVHAVLVLVAGRPISKRHHAFVLAKLDRRDLVFVD
jgi:hypothetical protein